MINRIILIGNGFDLAHGMPTSYRNFIDDHWSKRIMEYCSSDNDSYECDDFLAPKYRNDKPIGSFSEFHNYARTYGTKYKYKNRLLMNLSHKNAENWVDIESEYYYQLKESAKSGNTNNLFDISNLNSEFKKVTDLLETYLSKVEKNFKLEEKTYDTIKNHIQNPVLAQDLSEVLIRKVINDDWEILQPYMKVYDGFTTNTLTLTDSKRKILKDFILENSHRRSKEHFTHYILKNFQKIYLPENIFTEFINFNYTSTERLYANNENPVCHIHGELNSSENPIIFGYGDELDDFYPEIEKLNDNRFLDNVKSINYSKTDNYKKVLNIINDGFFQVYIMGHSCGNSDRTLLNTIFEHDNCASIKIFYHQKNETEDNYLDIYKNISRNFNDKTKLRDRVVSKKYSEPLLPYNL